MSGLISYLGGSPLWWLLIPVIVPLVVGIVLTVRERMRGSSRSQEHVVSDYQMLRNALRDPPRRPTSHRRP